MTTATVPVPSSAPWGREAHQLPAGRHGLARDQVKANQRGRILAAVIGVANVAGYSHMSVEDIIATAGVSRRTFYEHFPNKADAFIAAYDRIVTVAAPIIAKYAQAGDATAALYAALELFRTRPGYAEMLLVEVRAAGPDGAKRYDKTIQAVAQAITAVTNHTELAGEILAGGILEMLRVSITQHGVDGTFHLVDQLVAIVDAEIV